MKMSCMICLEETGDLMLTSCCCNTIHNKCSDDWISINSSCPYCRCMMYFLCEKQHLSLIKQLISGNITLDDLYSVIDSDALLIYMNNIDNLLFPDAFKTLDDNTLKLLNYFLSQKSLQSLNEYLLVSACENRIDLIKIILNYKVSINYIDENGDTALILNVRCGYNGISLLSLGADISHTDRYGYTILNYYVRDRRNLAPILVYVTDVNIYKEKDKSRRSIIHYLAESNYNIPNLDLICKRLGRHILSEILNEKDECHLSPLSISLEYNSFQMFKRLLEYGANLESDYIFDPKLLLHHSVDNNLLNFVYYSLENIDEITDSELHTILYIKSLKMFKKVLKKLRSLEVNVCGISHLLINSFIEKEEVLNKLYIIFELFPSEMKYKDVLRNSIVHLCILLNNREILYYLYILGVDMNELNILQETPYIVCDNLRLSNAQSALEHILYLN